MTLRIGYESRSFPSVYAVGSGTLTTNWNEVLAAALTVGRPSTYHVFRHGPSSFHEAIFRLSLVRMAIEQDWYGRPCRTAAFAALDPTEKGMVSYFLGMVFCKLFAEKRLGAPWLLHLDVFRNQIGARNLGRSRPDLVGQTLSGDWLAFESKGRSSAPSSSDKSKAKAQAQRLISVGGANCALHIGSFSFFRNEMLEFFWQDPEPDSKEPIALPEPDQEWRYYFEPALRLADELDAGPMVEERRMADVKVEIHPKILPLLRDGQWLSAKRLAVEMRESLTADGYRPDGVRVTAGDSWEKPFEARERG